MKRMKQFTSRMLAVMLAGTLAVGSLSVSAFGAEEAGSTVPAAEEFSLEEATENSAAEATATEEADGEVITESSSAEVVDGEGVTESPDAAFADTTQIATEEEAVTSYTVTLDANGGYFTNEWDDSIGDYVEQAEAVVKLIPVGGTVTAVPVFTDPDGQGMSFAGWSLDANGDFLPQEQEGYAPVGDCVLYAVWKVEEAASEGAEFARSTEFGEIPAYTEQEDFGNAESRNPSDTFWNTENSESSDVFENAENADPSDVEVPGPESDGTEDGLQDDGTDESEGAGIIDVAPAEEGEPDAFEDSASAENADIGDAADAPEIDGTGAGDGDGDSVFTESPEESTQSEPEVGENGGALDEAGSAQAENGNSNAQDEADVAAGQDQQDLLIPDQNADSGTVEGIESKPADVEADTFSEDIPGTEQSNGNVLRGEPEPETLEGEKALGEEVSDPGESGQFYYDIEDGKALIRGRVPDVYYDEEGNYDHEDNLSVVHLTIPNEINGCPVTYIEKFHDCENLQSVTLPEGLEEIGMEAFSGCRNLKQITFPSSLKRVCAGAFENTGLTSATIPAGAQTWDGVADNPYLPGVFSGCDSLSSITFEEGMTDISRGWCWGCTGLQTIKFPSTAKTIGYRTFADCGRLTSVVIPEGVTFIDSCAFENCENLQSVSLPSSLEGIENGAFMNTGLTSVRIPAGVDSGQHTAYYRNKPYYPGVFEQCDKLSEIWFEEGTEKVTRGWFFRCPGLETAHLPSTVKEINFRAFADCENLKNIELPEGLKYIDEQAFIGCSSLAGVDLPSSLVYVGEGAFAETGLTEVSVPAKADTDWNHGYDIGVFEDCDKLRTVRFEEGMTRIGQGWCRGCTGLETIEFPSTLKEIFYSFTHCKNLSTVNIPEGVSSLGNYSFAGCEKLSKINLPSTLTEVGWGAFQDCVSLTSVTLPANTSLVDTEAFAGCTGLKSFKAGKGLQNVRNNAFCDCTALEQIHFPEKLEYIDEEAFKNCTGLTDVFYAGTIENWKKITIEEGNDSLLSAAVHPAKIQPEKPVKYQITFNANGGTIKSGGKTVKTLSKSIEKGKKYGTLPMTSRSGYYLSGWYTAKSGGSRVTASTKATKKATVYARWVKGGIITYKLNGGTNNSANPAIYKSSTGVTLKNPTRKGYNFKGWFSDSSFKKKITGFKKGTSGNKTVYAKWEAKTYYIKFDGNGGTGFIPSIKTQYNKSVRLYGNLFTRKNYTFQGWSTSKTAKKADYKNKATVKNLSTGKNVTLYAVWKLNSYKIELYDVFSYTSEGHNGASITSETLTCSVNKTYTLPLNFSHSGYTFTGWSKKRGGKIVYKNKATVKNLSTKNGAVIELYANWKANTYTVKFNGNGGKASKAMADLACTFGKKATLPVNTFKLSGYKFMGWALKPDGDVKYKNKASVSNLTKKNKGVVTLYAQWGYTVKYLANNDSALTQVLSSLMIKGHNNKLISPDFGQTEGYFDSWNTKADGNGSVYTVLQSVDLKPDNTGSVTLYAQWDYGQLYWPVRKGDLTPITDISKRPGDIVAGQAHRGIDIGNADGAGWYAAYDGTVVYVFRGCITSGGEDHHICSPSHPELTASKNGYGVVCNNGFGNGCIIRSVIDGKTYYFQYAHMDSVSDTLQEGKEIKSDTYLGQVGNKGFSFGIHAHFEIDEETSPGNYWGRPVNNLPEGGEFTYRFK